MCEKDYNLLRPFDLEEAKRGGAVTCNTRGTVLHYVAGPDVGGTLCVKYEGGQFGLYKPEYLRMAPLCWVEGKPVYKGDVLYRFDSSCRIVVVSVSAATVADEVGCCHVIYSLTWTPPKVKREGWINIYERITKGRLSIAFVSDAFPTRKDADDNAANHRKACIHIEWEE